MNNNDPSAEKLVMISTGKRAKHECRTLRVEECAEILGIGRSSAYNLVRSAETTGQPFIVKRLSNSFLISKKSFYDYLDVSGF